MSKPYSEYRRKRFSDLTKHWPMHRRFRVWLKVKAMLLCMRVDEFFGAYKPAPGICPECGGKTKRNEKYDAYFCKPCDVYTEAKCGDPGCFFCSERPEKPSMIGAP